MNSRKCENCNVDVQRASFMKHIRSEKHIENIKENEMIIPECCFMSLLRIKFKKYIILNH